MAGHASMPRLGDNALLKLAPVIEALRPGFSGYDPTEAPLLMLEALGLDPTDVPAAIDAPRSGRAPTAAGDGRADAVRDADADDGRGIGEDQRDPGARIREGRLPRAAGAGRGRGAAASARAARRDRRRPRDRVHREGLRLPVARAQRADGRDRAVDRGASTRAPGRSRCCCRATRTRATSVPLSRI